MKASLPIAASLFACMLAAASAAITDPARVDVYVAPYYNSAGPSVKVGNFSSGLASKSDSEFVATIHAMKKQWKTLSFCQVYVAAIRLYDRGYRQEAVYWFYTAQYRGRQFALLVDRNKLGTLGDPGFELVRAEDAFLELAGPYVNGYAFGYPDSLANVIRRVQGENLSVAGLHAIYPGVAFASAAGWNSKNLELNQGLNQLVVMLSSQKDQIKRRRTQNGIEAEFARLTSTPLPN